MFRVARNLERQYRRLTKDGFPVEFLVMLWKAAHELSIEANRNEE